MMFSSTRIEASPIGMAHIEQPGERPLTKFEFSLMGMKPSEVELLKDDIEQLIQREVKEYNASDGLVKNETSKPTRENIIWRNG